MKNINTLPPQKRNIRYEEARKVALEKIYRRIEKITPEDRLEGKRIVKMMTYER